MTLKEYEDLREMNLFEPLWLDLLNASGYAGVLPNGGLVDRRYYPNAIPVQKNSVFGVEEPKELNEDQNTDEEDLVVCNELILNIYGFIGYIKREEYLECGMKTIKLWAKYPDLEKSKSNYTLFRISDNEPLVNQVERILARHDKNKEILFNILNGLSRKAIYLNALKGQY